MSDSLHTLETNPQSGAVKWLLEMEAVMDPTVQNTIILNIKQLDPSIKDVQLLFDTTSKAVLIYINLELSWWRKWRTRDGVIPELIENQIAQALPSYRRRVITDYSIFEKSLKLVGAV